ncbi:MAG TPA: amino acid ABC transporter ATP-binding protein [Syntrophales bacterium]|nr:amino acid ABC transporter ATP-binding protein [Syntrophales bacterium]
MADTIPILRIENMTKRYGDNEVLKGASLTINRGELKVLIGPSGGGKSTFLQCINFLVKPERGRIWLDGKEIIRTRKKEINKYRQKVGMIFQDFNLFDHLTALHNVRIALVRVKGMSKEEAQDRAVRELDRVGLKGYMNQYPAELSGGQKQRVSIARALAMDPDIMLLDEPTSALDPELISEVLDVIRTVRSDGMTMIMSTHQIGFASEMADEFVFLEDGTIVETGPPEKILLNAQYARTREFCSKITELYGNSFS